MAVPGSIFLPEHEEIGGYIFMGSDATLLEAFRRQILGLPGYYVLSVQAIQPGTPLFIFNYSTGYLYGIYEAVGWGGYNLDPYAWPDVNHRCRSFYSTRRRRRSIFPAQVRIRCRRPCNFLEWRITSRILGVLSVGNGRFRVELTHREAQIIMDMFDDHEAWSRRQR